MTPTQRSHLPKNPALSKTENSLVNQKNSKWSTTTQITVTSAIATSILGAGFFAYDYLTKVTPPPITIPPATPPPYTNFQATLALLAVSIIGLKAKTIISKFKHSNNERLVTHDRNFQQQPKATNKEVDDKYNEAISILESLENQSVIFPTVDNQKKTETLADNVIFLVINNELEKTKEITNKCPKTLLNQMQSVMIYFLADMSKEFMENNTIKKNSRNEVILFLDYINILIIQKNTNHFESTIDFFKSIFGLYQKETGDLFDFKVKSTLLKILSEFKTDKEIEDKVFGLIYSFMNEATKTLWKNNYARAHIEEIIFPFMNKDPKFFAHYIQKDPISAGRFAQFYQNKFKHQSQTSLKENEPFAFEILQEANACFFQDSPRFIKTQEAIFTITFLLDNTITFLLDNFDVINSSFFLPLINFYEDLCNKSIIKKTIEDLLNPSIKPSEISIKMAKIACKVHNKEDLLTQLTKRENQLHDDEDSDPEGILFSDAHQDLLQKSTKIQYSSFDSSEDSDSTSNHYSDSSENNDSSITKQINHDT